MITTENNRQKMFILKGMISQGIILVVKSTKQENLLVEMESVGSYSTSSVRCFSLNSFLSTYAQCVRCISLNMCKKGNCVTFFVLSQDKKDYLNEQIKIVSNKVMSLLSQTNFYWFNIFYSWYAFMHSYFDLKAWESKWTAKVITSRIYWLSRQYLHQQWKLFGSLITFF